jgi:hypothetical protein
MADHSINSLLGKRGAWLKGDPGDVSGALARSQLTRLIGENYIDFERVRDGVMASPLSGGVKQPLGPPASDLELDIVEMMRTAGILENGITVTETIGRKYLSGGWLEELAWLAAVEAGAEEAVHGQVLGWKVGKYSGENEIDLIARQGDVLTFVSCKALRSELDMKDRKHRNRLMDAVHEADNLADHFGRSGERVAVLVTTDLHDEVRGAPRYAALMGKAAVLDVRLISLEHLHWQELVTAMQGLWQEQEKTG